MLVGALEWYGQVVRFILFVVEFVTVDGYDHWLFCCQEMVCVLVVGLWGVDLYIFGVQVMKGVFITCVH